MFAHPTEKVEQGDGCKIFVLNYHPAGSNRTNLTLIGFKGCATIASSTQQWVLYNIPWIAIKLAELFNTLVVFLPLKSDGLTFVEVVKELPLWNP